MKNINSLVANRSHSPFALRKKIICIILLSMFFFTQFCTVSTYAEQGTITENEIEILVSDAIKAFNRVHRNSEDWWGGIYGSVLPEEYNTVSKMSEYFKRIYTSDIADDAWMYSFNLKPTSHSIYYPAHAEGDKVLTYSVDSSGVLQISDNYANEFSSLYQFNSDLATAIPFDVIQNISGDTQNATATVALLYSECDFPEYITVNISFIMTENGWRITSSGFTDAVIKNDTSAHTSIVSGLWNYFTPIVFRHLWENTELSEKYNTGLLDTIYLNKCSDIKILSVWDEKMTLAVRLKNKQTSADEWYTAEFEISHERNQTEEWQRLNLTGGELKQLLDGKDAIQYNPQTGDNADIIVTGLIGLVSFALMLYYKRRFCND